MATQSLIRSSTGMFAKNRRIVFHIFFTILIFLQISGITYHCLILPVRKLLIIWKLLCEVIVKDRDILELHRGEPRGKKIINDMPPLKNYRNEHNWYWMMFKVFNLKRRRIGINNFDINHMKRSKQRAKLGFLTIPFKMFVICTSSSFPYPCNSVLILLMYSFII